MIPHIPQQRKHKSNASSPFDDLVSYIESDHEQEKGQGRELEPKKEKKELGSKFSDLLDYATQSTDKETNVEKCLAIRTHGVTGIKTASIEMNTVAAQNKRCEDPAYHIILSWPEHEKPESGAIFDAAEHALKALGLAEHQYVLAIHGNTDNIHCHISVNRVHPITFKSRNIEWAIKTLHMAARESEIKHGWTHDNGIYIVETNGHGKKRIVANPDHIHAITQPHAHGQGRDAPEKILPAWYDADSLESWLKTDVTKSLKKAIKTLDGWPELHAWLDQYGITLSDTGGGGMRLRAQSNETGEILDIAASKGLRLIHRKDLEAKWGPFANSTPVPCIVPDLSHLTPDQLQKGINDVLTRDFIDGRPPQHILDRDANRATRPDNDLIRDHELAEGTEAERGSRLHELPTGRVDDERQHPDMPLPHTLQNRVGDTRTGQDSNMRRPGATEAGSRSQRSLNRDDSKRQERKELRARQRIDLRNRFAQYKRFVQDGDTEHYLNLKQTVTERRQLLKAVKEQTFAAISNIPKHSTPAEKLQVRIEIDAARLRQTLQIEADHQTKLKVLKARRVPPLSWRIWLHEQSNLGDQAALSALRGIVYQAQRDAKKKESEEEEEEPSFETDEQKFKKLMKRLLDEEKRENAIRAANMVHMRPYEADAVLKNYLGIQWQVTGNGNVEYSKITGDHLFTDRGNRITFDREIVTDDDVRLALVHAQQKFGNELTLTGDDPRFKERMARIADDMGMTVLNPELQDAITAHRNARVLELSEAVIISPTHIKPELPVVTNVPETDQMLSPALESGHAQLNQPEPTHQADPTEPASIPVPAPLKQPESEPTVPVDTLPMPATPPTTRERLRELVLSIDPRATFADPVTQAHTYIGRVAAELEKTESETNVEGFAQHIGQGVYVIHAINAPTEHDGNPIEVRYRQGNISMQIKDHGKGRAG